jgi:hypothetical protein
VFPVRYELNSYILLRRNPVFKGLLMEEVTASMAVNIRIGSGVKGSQDSVGRSFQGRCNANETAPDKIIS